MSSELTDLYSQRLLALAADIPHLGTLDAPQASVRERAPLCGSAVSVDLVLTDGKVTAFAQDVKACALGQAAAAVLGHAIMGCTPSQIETAREQLKAFLRAEGPAPEAPFDGFEALLPAQEFKNRHASILLAVTAAHKACLEAAQTP